MTTTTTRKRILIAEDEPVCSLIAQRILEKSGYDVTVVRDGEAALKEFDKREYYAVIADWMLPELDGIEVVRRITSREGNKAKAYLTSVIDIPAAREHAAAVGARDFLPKPITPAALMKALKSEAKPLGKAQEGNHPMTRAACWPNLPIMSCNPIVELLGGDVALELATAVPSDPVGLTCGLVDAQNGGELTLWIIARESAAITVATSMLGEAPANVQEASEALAEILNVVAGVVKTEFVNHGFKFTIVLPARRPAAEIRGITEKAFASIVTNVTLGETSFSLGFSAGAAGAVEMRVEDLREGYVLAEDMKNASGSLVLLPACTRLTATAAQRLRESCKGRMIRVHLPMASVA